MKKNIKINSNTLFYIALVLAEMGWMFTNIKYISKLTDLFINGAVLLLTICCIIQSKIYSKKSLILIALLILSFLINNFIIKNSTMLLLLLFCVACKNIDLDKLIAFNWKLQLALIIFVLICYFLGETSIYYMYRDDGTIRSSMGFSHPNTFAMYLFSNFCQFLYSNYKKLSIKSFVCVGLVLAYIASVFSDSRGSVYSFIILLIASIIIKLNKNIINYISSKKIITRFVYLIPIFLTVISMTIALKYDSSNQILYNLNKKLTGRVSSAHRITKDYDIKLFGQKLELVSTAEASKTGKNPLVLDNSYVKIIYQYGLCIFMFFIIFYCLSIKKSILEKNSILMIILIIFAIRGLTGNILFNLYGNTFLLFFSKILYKNKISSN